jgi:hypothetical protein
VSIEAAKSGSGLLCNGDNVYQVEKLLTDLGYYFAEQCENKAELDTTARTVLFSYDNPLFKTKALSLEDFALYVSGVSIKTTRESAAELIAYQRCCEILKGARKTVKSLAGFLKSNGFSDFQVNAGFRSALRTLQLAVVKYEIYRRTHTPDGFKKKEKIVVVPGAYPVSFIGMQNGLSAIMTTPTEKLGDVIEGIHSKSVSGLVCRLIISAFMADWAEKRTQKKTLTLEADNPDVSTVLICAMTSEISSCRLRNVRSNWFNTVKFAANKLENECTLFGGNPADTETSGEGPAGAGSGAGMQTLTKAAGSPVAVDTMHESAKATAMPQGESGSGSIGTMCAGAGSGVCVGGAGAGSGDGSYPGVGESVIAPTIEPMAQRCIEKLSIPELTGIANRCSSEANALEQVITSLLREIEEKISEVETTGAVVDMNKGNIDSAPNDKIRAAMTAQWEKSSAELVVLQSELDKMKADLASTREQREVLVKKHQL